MIQRLIPLCILGLSGAAAGVSAAEPVELPQLVVHEQRILTPSISVLNPEDPDVGMPSDGADFLRRVPGVSASRMGGHGLEPVIRGQSQGRLNILLDGAYLHGGCPNRMDPPSSFVPMETYDRIVVIKGAQSVRYGAGGSGGTVLFERDTHPLAAGETVRGRVGGGLTGNSQTRDAYADLTFGGPRTYVRTIANAKDADNYSDGDGNEVRSAFKEKGLNVLLGYLPAPSTVLELGLEASRRRDVLFAGAGMDSPLDDNDTVRLKLDRRAPIGAFENLKAELYRADVTHRMDNYTLRTLTAPAKMRVDSSALADGGRLSGDIASANGMLWTLGIDFQGGNQDATRYNDSASPAVAQSVMWPDVDNRQTGLFAELELGLGTGNRLRSGLRYDHAEASAGRAGEDPPGMPLSPNALYTLYYGAPAADHEEDNWGGFLRLEHELERLPGQVFLGFSRSLRSADATERYIAANGATPNQRWVGNPSLAPERHNEGEVGVQLNGGAWDLVASLYLDSVQDFILRDRARAQSGILRADNATIYRNVDAELYGYELSAGRRWGTHWSAELALAYVHATNTTEDRPVAQIPPLQGTASLSYAARLWTLGGRLRMAAKQDRVDTDPNTGSGLDARATPGFAVLDLYGSYRLGKQLRLAYGIDNAFDRGYAEHLNRSSAFDVDQVQVNEPGRTLWVRASFQL